MVREIIEAGLVELDHRKTAPELLALILPALGQASSTAGPAPKGRRAMKMLTAAKRKGEELPNEGLLRTERNRYRKQLRRKAKERDEALCFSLLLLTQMITSCF